MQKRTMMAVMMFMIAMVWCVNVYAGGDGAVNNCPVHGFFTSLGGFLYNALPWNWGNWMGK